MELKPILEKEEGQVTTKHQKVQRSAFTEAFAEILLAIVFQRFKEIVWSQVLFQKNLFDSISRVSYLRNMWSDEERTVQVDQGECVSCLDSIFSSKLRRKSPSTLFANNDGCCFHIRSLFQGFNTDLFIPILRR